MSRRSLASSSLRLARDLVFSPRAAFEAFGRGDSALRESIMIYSAFLASYAAYYALKPVDFPSMMRNAGLEPRGFLFWLGAGLMGTALYAIWLLVLAAFLNVSRERVLPAAIVLQLVWTAASGVLLLLFAQKRIGLPVLALGTLAVSAPGAWLVRAKPVPWRPMISLLLAVNLLALLSFGPLGVAAWLRAEAPYMAIQFGFMLWMLGLTASGLRSVTGIPLPRCFVSLGLSFIVSIFVLFGLYLAGFVPPELLKASMAV